MTLIKILWREIRGTISGASLETFNAYNAV